MKGGMLQHEVVMWFDIVVDHQNHFSPGGPDTGIARDGTAAGRRIADVTEFAWKAPHRIFKDRLGGILRSVVDEDDLVRNSF